MDALCHANAGPYHRFVRETFHATADELPPGTSFTAIVRKVCLKWRKLPEEGKQKYRDSYALERDQRAAAKLVGALGQCLVMWRLQQ